jgi:hypothetical protein
LTKTIDGKVAGMRKSTALGERSSIEAAARPGGIQGHLDDEDWKLRSTLEEIKSERETKEVDDLLEEIARVNTVLEEVGGRPFNRESHLNVPHQAPLDIHFWPIFHVVSFERLTIDATLFFSRVRSTWS